MRNAPAFDPGYILGSLSGVSREIIHKLGSKLFNGPTHAAFYGLSTAATVFNVVILTVQRRTDRTSWPLLSTTITMFLCTTIHFTANGIRQVNAFINITSPEDRELFFEGVRDPLYITQSVAYAFQIVCADLFMLYRVWMLWNHSYIVAGLASLSYWGYCVSAIGLLYTESAAATLEDFTPWIRAFFATTLVTNVVCSGLVAYRIWSTNRVVRRLGTGASLSNLVVIILESAALYVAVVVIGLILLLLNSPALYFLLTPACSINGLIFSIVILRAGLNTELTRSRDQRPESLVAYGRSQMASTRNYPMTPIAVNVDVQQFKESDAGTESLEDRLDGKNMR